MKIQLSKPSLKTKGFTLLELLLALSIFSILSLLAYAGLGQFLRTQQHLEQQDEQLRRLQLSIQRLETDLQQAINRPIRNQFGDTIAALIGSRDSIEFTRSGWQNYQQQKRSDLQRVAWLLNTGNLERLHWQVLDRAQDSQAQSVLLLTNIKDLKWQYMDSNAKVYESWPPTITANETMPHLMALTLNIESQNWGHIQRIFELPQAVFTNKKIK